MTVRTGAKGTARPTGAMEKMQQRQGRIIRAKGRAQTSRDFDRKDFITVKLLNPKFENKATIWFPAGKKSFDDGKPFIFRLLPALSLGNTFQRQQIQY